MNIGIIVDNDLNSDIRVLREIRILKESHHNISVLCFGFTGKNYSAPFDGIIIERIHISRKLKDTLFFFMNMFPFYEWIWVNKISKLIRVHDLNYLHVHDLYMARAAAMGIRRSGKSIPMILDLHENYPYTIKTYNWTKGFPRKLLSMPDKWEKKEHEYLNYASTIIVLSNEFKNVLISKYRDLGKKSFAVFPNVPDLSQPEYNSVRKAENPFSNGFPILLYYGVIAERRGIFDTLKVFESIIKEEYPVNLLLIGPVDKKDQALFSEMTNSLASSGRLHYIPWIRSADFPGFLAIIDICLAPFHRNPQHESGVANKIYDYMLGGKPVIVSDCKPQQHLIEKYNCGLVFSDLEEFRTAIIRLLNDEPLRKEMGINGKKAIMSDYNAGIFKNDLLMIYNVQSS